MNDSPSTTDRSTNHIPGPWHSDALPKPHPDTGQTSGWILGAGDGLEEDAPTVAWIEEVYPADLRLMVAAPELLAALKATGACEIAHCYCWCVPPSCLPCHAHEDACLQARAAIATATEGQP
jgi:hypothetical protein